MLVLLKKMW